MEHFLPVACTKGVAVPVEIETTPRVVLKLKIVTTKL